MDAVAANKETDISLIYDYTRNAFVPLLEARRAEIESYKRKTYRYGDKDRQELDVYYPHVTGKVPVLFFIYGGGFVQGNRVFPPPHDLAYRNVGAFFAKQGFVTVIADYRLVPHVKFPEPFEDLRDAISWVVRNAEQIDSEGQLQVDTQNIFTMSHSAGSILLSTVVLHPTLLPHHLRSRIRGVILTGGAYEFSPEENKAMEDILLKLYGSWDDVKVKTPSPLLRNASEDVLGSFPEVFLLASEWEPKGVIAANEAFAATLKEKLGKDIPFSLMKAHNHISPHWALMTGEGEEWAFEVSAWVRTKYLAI
ncbi:alpha/beta-hydrolase [Wolfiporia cocos MD-104 SS10]|uniref:Alpha/beta-hydrolase n=1 Tax=Wolfiporia cocos (strain MD-104) TaxID=742152 RepID=A0A2H3JDJ6_WOLCO|nr:alpha/beta-hydrolase [Wolfiporia cocos MD-104 SS10]